MDRSKISAYSLSIFGLLSIGLTLCLLVPSLWRPLQAYESLVLGSSSAPQIPIKLQGDGQAVKSLGLSLLRTEQTARLAAIELKFATYLQKIKVNKARIEFPELSCSFVSDTKLIEDNQVLRFTAQACDVSANTATATHLAPQLVLELENPTVALALWAQESLPQAKTAVPLTLADDQMKHPSGALFFSYSSAIKTRLDLILAMWSPALHPVFLLFLLSLLLVGLGVFWLVPRRGRFRVGVFTFCTALSWSMIFTIVTPPLQAPDEADHFLTYVSYFGHAEHQKEALEAMNRSHYFKTFCKEGGYLSAFDFEHPQCEPWPEHAPVLDYQLRAPGAKLVWTLYQKILQERGALALILGIRFLNAFLIAAVLGLAAFLLERWAGGGFGLAPLLSCSQIPSFWVLTGHITNHVFIGLGYLGLVFLSLATLRLRRVPWPFLYGVSVLVLVSLTMGRTSVLIFGMFLGLILLGLLSQSAYWKTSLCLLVFLNAILAFLFWAFRSSPYLIDIYGQLSAHAFAVEGIFFGGLGLQLLGVCAAIGMGRWIKQKKASRSQSIGMQVFSVLIFLAILLCPLFYREHFDNLEVVARPEMKVYMRNIMVTLGTNLGLWGDDFLLIRTLWGGFGCPDNFFPMAMIEVPKLLTLVGMFFLAYFSFRRARWVDVSKFLGLFGLFLVYFILIAIACWYSLYSIHGRYTLGWGLGISALGSYGLYLLCLAKDRRVFGLLAVMVSIFIPSLSAMILLNHYYR